MPGILPENLTFDYGQSIMKNIVDLYARKQHLDEQSKLQDIKYQKEQELWEKRQVSDEERQKRMSEYAEERGLRAQESAALNKRKIDEASHLEDWRNQSLYRAKTDEQYKNYMIKTYGEDYESQLQQITMENV